MPTRFVAPLSVLQPRSCRRPAPVITLLCVAVFLGSVSGGAAQTPGSMAGQVLDPSGSPVPSAAVVVRPDAGAAREVRTAPDGTFALGGLLTGNCRVSAIVPGFRSDTLTVTVTAGSTTTVALTLRVSAVTETMVVSAAYVETPLSETPVGASSISRVDIEARQLVTVAGALSLTPGAAVAANGGLGSVTSVFPRGGESDFTLVLIDGVKVNSFGGGIDFGHLSTGGLSSIEVVRGPQSAVFGADAIGGVVHLRTGIGGATAASASMEAGGYGTSRFLAGSTGSLGALSWGAHVERLSSDGWTGAAPGSGLPVSNDDYEGLSVAVSGSWAASSRTTVRLDTRVASNQRGYPGPFGADPIGAFPGVDTVSRGANDLALGALSVVHRWTPKTTLRARGSWMSMDSDFSSPWDDSMSRTRRWTGHAQLDRVFSPWLDASAGIDVSGERADSTYITGPSADRIPVERRVEGYFGEARIRAASRLFLTTGLRAEHIVRAAIAADPFGWTPRPAMPEEAILSWNPRVAVSYYVRTSDESEGNWSRAHASAGTGIRAPDAFELTFTDNPALKPERSRSLDAGFEQSLIGGKLVLDASAFVNTYDDLIVAVGPAFASASRYRTDNIANARAQGLELSAAWRTGWGLEARMAYSYVNSEILAVDRVSGEAPAPFSVGDPLIRRPRHQASGDILMARKSWTVFGQVAGRGQVLDVEPNYGAFGGIWQAAGFVVVGAGGSVKLGRHAELIGRVDNLFDRQYESALGFPATGRMVTVGVRVAAGR